MVLKMVRYCIVCAGNKVVHEQKQIYNLIEIFTDCKRIRLYRVQKAILR